jgi:ABC-type lipoprotein export system ATPase subunit
MKEIISLKNVIKLYGQQRAINGVSLQVNENERVLVKGAPGSGKSTLLKLIAGMERPSAGEIFVMEKALHETGSDALSVFRSRYMGVILEDPCLLPELSVLENVALPLTVRGISALKREKAAMEVLKALGAAYLAHTSPEKISVYEAQAASLARALVGQPKILLLDEAAARLSEREIGKLGGILSAIQELGDYTIMSFSAEEDGILNTGKRIALNHGTIKEDKL